MTKRLSISVPDSTAKLAKELKEQKVNISNVCAKAIERHHKMQQETEQESDIMRAAARLRAQRLVLEDETKANGFQWGRDFVLEGDGDYQTIVELAWLWDDSRGYEEAAWQNLCSKLDEDTEHSLIYSLEIQEERDGKAINRNQFAVGVFEGLISAWKQVRPHVEE